MIGCLFLQVAKDNKIRGSSISTYHQHPAESEVTLERKRCPVETDLGHASLTLTSFLQVFRGYGVEGLIYGGPTTQSADAGSCACLPIVWSAKRRSWKLSQTFAKHA